jgi:putative ABC transport system ATP-binding protein
MNVAPAEPLLAIEALRFRWQRGGPWVLDIPALMLAPGEQLFMAGPSGCGKSSLLSVIAGVAVAESGAVRILGQSLSGMRGAARDRFRADHMGVVFQLFNLLPYLSVLENVTLPCRFSRARREKAAASGGAEAEARRLLAHLELADESLLRRPVTELSVGQQQRVAAARALLGRPELIVADEPTSALDTELRTAFVDLLARECEAAGAALIFVSHDRSLAGRFHRRLELPEVNRA